MDIDDDAAYRAVAARDARFDGRVFTAVRTTGIYCRPICPARTPYRRNVSFYSTAAAAERAGYRACRRCRPDASPDSPDWDVRSDLVGRALRLIAEGVVDAEGVPGLARRLAVSERHLHRVMTAEIGAGPLAIARSRRAHLAGQLLAETDRPVTWIAFASGFGSVRQFNDTILSTYDRPPSALRQDRATDNGSEPAGRLAVGSSTVSLRLPFRTPLEVEALAAHLARHAVPGVESVVRSPSDAGVLYRRTTPAGPIELSVDPGEVRLRFAARDPALLAPVVAAGRRLLDLDADPAAIGAALAADPLLAPLVSARPGLRLPGGWDGFEAAVGAVAGQGVTVAAARRALGRLAAVAGDRAVEGPGDSAVEAAGEPAGPAAADTLTRCFPTPFQVAALGDATLATVGLTGARSRAIRTLATAVVAGDVVLDGGADPHTTLAELRRVPGIGPWTAAVIAMRVLRDPDAFPSGDAALLRAARAVGLPGTAADLDRAAARWQPWRAYAATHLWAADQRGTP